MTDVKLTPPTPHDCLAVAKWRNEDAVRSSLRTPIMLTEGQQLQFYDALQDRHSPHRYWSVTRSVVHADVSPVGFGGLTNISWENGSAEISLIISPSYRGKGCGSAAVRLLLDEAFLRMRLSYVFGECYECSQAYGFWKKQAEHYSACTVMLPDRKFWNGKMHDSLYFSIYAGAWV